MDFRERNDMRGLSDSTLLGMLRKAVLKLFGGKCFFCGAHYLSVPVAIHHIVKRKMLLLRYSYQNTIPVCDSLHEKNKHLKMTCHQYAETPDGRKQISDYLVKKGYLGYLQERDSQSKQWFVRNGITKNDYLSTMKKELQEIIDVH